MCHAHYKIVRMGTRENVCPYVCLYVCMSVGRLQPTRFDLETRNLVYTIKIHQVRTPLILTQIGWPQDQKVKGHAKF